MTTNDFINDCVQCIDMCRKEFSDEFTEWIEKLILTQVADTSESKECVTDAKSTTKELSVENIKKELMDAFLNDMRIINSFTNKNVKKTTDYIGKNIFDYLESSEGRWLTDTYINFDVDDEENGYGICITLKMHKDCVRQNNKNKLDTIANIISDIVNELYPYRIAFVNRSVGCENHYVERKICFSLVKDYY